VARTPAFQAGDRGFDPRRPYYLVNVFTGADGSYGNPLAVFLDGAAIPEPARRQAIAADLGYSETVFVDDASTGRLRIFTPASELPLAGHPLVGTAWVIARERGSCDTLRPPAGEVATWQDGDVRWIRGRPEWAPPLELREYGSPDEVDALDGAPDGLGFAYCWAWIDEAAGLVRARSFVPEHGIHEDEATGVAALRLGGELGRSLEVRQGEGSRIYVRPGPDGSVAVGGRVVDRGQRTYGD
jgi:predicted PhzF superfamily epimerase YddE/YHI9